MLKPFLVFTSCYDGEVLVASFDLYEEAQQYIEEQGQFKCYYYIETIE